MFLLARLALGNQSEAERLAQPENNSDRPQAVRPSALRLSSLVLARSNAREASHLNVRIDHAPRFGAFVVLHPEVAPLLGEGDPAHQNRAIVELDQPIARIDPDPGPGIV